MISIIIPIYNDEKYIEECLNSVLNQTYTDFECMCLDDGSTDNTIEKIKKYCSIDKRFKLFLNNHKGPGWQRNFGIEHSTGEYIAFLDHDDYVEPDWLENLYITLTDNNTDITYCAHKEIYEPEGKTINCLYSSKLKEKMIISNVKDIPSDFLCKYFAPWKRLIKRDYIIKNHIKFAEGNFKFDDVLFTWELMLNTHSISFTNKTLYTHRIFKQSITGNSFNNKDIYFEPFDTVVELEKYCNEYLSKYYLILLLEKVIPFFEYYLFYVDSTEDYYKKMKKLIFSNNLSLKCKLKLVKYKIRIQKSKITKNINSLHTILFFKKVLNKIKRELNYYLINKNQKKIDKKEYDSSKINVNCVGCWETIRENIYDLSFSKPLFQVLSETKNDKKGFQYSSYKPDIEFFSVNSKHNEMEKSRAKIKIFYTGEDVNKNYTNFKDLLLDKSDLSLGFDYPKFRNNAENYLRYPFWLTRYFYFTEDKDKIKEIVDSFNDRRSSREKFCSYVAFHDNNGIRRKMIDIAERVATVNCGGKSYHNDDTLITIYNDDKTKYISNFMINICPENVSVEGYITEKLFQSFEAGCIPFYYGAEGKSESFINTETILFYNGKNDEEMYEKIKLLKDNQNYYEKFISQKRFLDNAVDEIYKMNHDLKEKYKEIINKKKNLL